MRHPALKEAAAHFGSAAERLWALVWRQRPSRAKRRHPWRQRSGISQEKIQGKLDGASGLQSLTGEDFQLVQRV